MVEAETWKWIKALNGTIEMNKQRIKTMEEANAFLAESIKAEVELLESRLSKLEGETKK